jgi:prepilin-type N-terminal cleavage/methylation domain-containing protein
LGASAIPSKNADPFLGGDFLKEGDTMVFIKKRDGFTLIEALIVVTVIGILIAMGGTLAGKFASRRQADNITGNISSTLQLTKLKALRQGVEYQAVLTFDPTERTLTIETERGNSNRGSSSYIQETSQTIKVKEGYVLNPASKTYNFNPNGTLGGASGTVDIKPSSGEKGERCGKIVVSPFGRIRVIQGNWDPSGGGDCKPIL